MNNKPPSWRDTLSRYLEASNEDSQVVSYFEQSIAPKICPRENLVWLDIGPGPGTKTFSMYKALLNAGIHVTQAQAIEPDSVWRSEFLSRASDFFYCFPWARQLVLSPTSLHDLNQPQSSPLRFQEPNFITCIHVLYEASLVEDFGAYLEGRSSYCAWVVVESSSSALWQMRKIISETLGLSIPLGAEHAVRQMLTDRRIKYREDLILDQTCQIQSADDIREWLLPFLLGVSPQEIGNINQQTVIASMDLVEEYVAKQNWMLAVPDVAFHLKNY